jgi:hypothetical protein
MSIMRKLPRGATVLPATMEITAAYNCGIFDFSKPVNPQTLAPLTGSNLLCKILSGNLYIFDSMTFACNINELDYEDAILTVPTVQVSTEQNNVALFQGALALPAYADGASYGFEFQAKSGSGANPDYLSVAMTGQLQVTRALVGAASITALFSFVGYEISSAAAIKKYLEDE